MRSNFTIILIVLSIWLLTACASSPKFNLENVVQDVNVQLLTADVNQYQGKKILLGGVIISSKNIEAGTQFEILAYPLGDYLRPNIELKTQGRFIAISKRYMETIDYASGRVVSLIGLASKTISGTIGDAQYTYPVIDVQQIHLWSDNNREEMDTRIQFGIGVVFH